MIPAIVIFPVLTLVICFLMTVREIYNYNKNNSIGLILTASVTKMQRNYMSTLHTVAIVFLAMLSVALIGLMSAPKVYSLVEYSKVEIVSMDDAISNKGMFLEMGKDGWGEYYIFYEKTSVGKNLVLIYKHDGALYEDSHKDAYIVTFVRKRVWSKSWLFNFFMPTFFHYSVGDYAGYEIHIPKGSIRQGINLPLPQN